MSYSYHIHYISIYTLGASTSAVLSAILDQIQGNAPAGWIMIWVWTWWCTNLMNLWRPADLLCLYIWCLRYAGDVSRFLVPISEDQRATCSTKDTWWVFRAVSLTRLQARDQYTASTLLGGKGGAGPKFASHIYAWGTKGVCECKMDEKPTWIPTCHQMDCV